MKQKENRARWGKRFLSAACLTVLVCALSACTPTVVGTEGTRTGGAVSAQPEENNPAPQTSAQTPAVSQSGSSLTDLLEPVKLPDEYLITYEVMEDEQLFTVTKGQDAEGRVYFQFGDETAVLFVPADGGRYQLYAPDTDGVFAPSGGNLYTAKYVETATADFMEYAQQSTSRFNGVAVLTGTQEVAGRPCDLYTFDVTVLNFTNQYTLAIDQETGACLLWQKVTGVSGHVTSEDGSFTCTEFSTENVELPISF